MSEQQQQQQELPPQYAKLRPSTFENNSSVSPSFFSDKVKIYNILVFVLLFLTWVATCIAFGGALHSSEQAVTGVKGTFYWNKVVVGSDEFEYNKFHMENDDLGSKCDSGGKGLIALGTLTFLCVTCSITLFVLRMLSRQQIVPVIGNNIKKYLTTEVILSFVATLLVFFMTMIWGATCFKATKDSAGFASPTATGFAFICLSLFFMIAENVLMYLIKGSHVGGGSTNPQPLLDPTVIP